MKTKHLLLLVLIAAISSCSSAFKTGQTPDDVYYSPAPAPPVEYVRTDNQQDRDKYAYNNTYSSEDLAIRRGINDPRYRSNFSLDFGSGYSPYDYYGSSFYSPYSSYYNPYTYPGVTFYPYNYNYYGYYSPFNSYYYPPVYIINKNGTPSGYYNHPRTYNLGAYNNNTNANTNRVYTHPGEPTSNPAPVRTFETRTANGSGVGNLIRRVFTPSNNTRSYSNNNTRSYNNDNSSNNNSSNNNSSPVRTIQSNNSGSSSSSSSSSSGSSAPVRTFRK